MFSYNIFLCFVLLLYVNKTKGLNSRRIMGGTEEDILCVPYQVSVQYENDHFCGGCIIGPRHILTAAHCLESNQPNDYSIRAGSSYHAQGGIVMQVVKIFSHEDYDSKTLNNDIAVFELEKPLKWTENIQAIDLANEEPEPEKVVTISGWGLNDENSTNLTSILQKISVPVVSRETCQSWYADIEKNITEAMFCAGYLEGKIDSCQGDSGGPVVLDDKLVGIVSWGNGCGREKYPGINSNVAFLKSWIESKMSETNF